jgi:tetratricopeptide (TPR) repeat protein
MAKQAKDEGNKCFKGEKYGKAVAYYKTGLSKLRSARNKNFPVGDLGESADTLEVSLNVNTAMCLVKTEEWEDAITAAGQALRKDPANAKALLFRARGLIASLHRADGKFRARDDLLAALKVNPKDKAIATELANLEKELGGTTMSAQSNKDPQVSSNMPKRIIATKTQNEMEKEEEEAVLRENFKSAKKPLLVDERSTKPKETKTEPPMQTFKTKEEWEQHMLFEAEMVKRKKEADEVAFLLAKKKEEEEAEDEALMNGTALNKASHSGYKIDADGHKVPVWSREQVVIPTEAPKRVEVGEGEDTDSKIQFNRGFRERDMTQW